MSNLELNKGDNFIFCIDVSGSMQATDTPNGSQRIDYLKENVKTFIQEAGKWDEDGVDIVTFGHTVKHLGAVNTEKAESLVGALRANESATDTAGAIRTAYGLHTKGGYKQSVCFLATDGEPSDEDAVFKTIAGITQELKDEHEFAISILTVGNPSAGLQAFLSKLDDALPGAKYDIVDVKALDSVNFIEAFAGALHD
jgi:uncharacterized protein YegL